MVFQARKWGWKRIAARMLLVPMLAGGSAAIAHAQVRTAGGLAAGVPVGQVRPNQPNNTMRPNTAPPAQSRQAPPSAPAQPVDPKAMIKEGRKALAEGRFNDARDLAQRAEASNPTGKWGLFDDTPNALRKDIDKAQMKAQRDESDRLVKHVKEMLDQKSETPAARAAVLDSALQMARRAEQLHGPYSNWDFTNRADKLVKEIDEERSKLTALPPPPQTGTGTAAATPGSRPSFASTLPPTGAPNHGDVRPAAGSSKPGSPGGVTNAGGFFPDGKMPPNVKGGKAPPASPDRARPNTPPVASKPVSPPATTASRVTTPDNDKVPEKLLHSTPPTPPDSLFPDPVASAPTQPMGAEPHSTPPSSLDDLMPSPVASKPMEPRSTPPTPPRSLPSEPVASTPATPPSFPSSPLASTPPSMPGEPLHSTPPSPPKFFPSPSNSVAAAPARPPAVDTKKADAVRLMTEAKRLADRGDLVGAHAKYTEAMKIGADFAAREYSPGFALQELGARGAATIDRLVAEARSQMAKNDFAKAEAALNAASEIAEALNLFPRPIEEAKNALRLASSGKHGGVPPGGLAPAGGAETLVQVGPAPIGPGVPVMAPGTTPKPVSTGGQITGRQLLDQAALEFRKGDFEMARRLALQAHNLGGVQAEAHGLLNQIDAEVFAAKQRTAAKSFEAAVASVKSKDHGHALGVLVLIDPKLLPENLRAQRDELIAACKAQVDKNGDEPRDAGVVAAASAEPPKTGALDPMGGMPPMKSSPPGLARVGGPDKPAASPDNLAYQVDAMKKVKLQKLRQEGLDIQANAQAAFGRGETDIAIQMLLDFSNRVRSEKLEPASVALLLRPVESRLEMFRIMKGQTDALAREKREKSEARELLAGRGAADEQRKAEVQKLVREYHALVQHSEYAKAERVALQAKQLEPDDPAISSLAYMAKINRRVKEQEKLKSDKEIFVYEGLYNAEVEGPLVTTENPVSVKLEALKRSRGRGSLDDVFIKSRTPAEFEIEMKLDKPISIEFTQTPLRTAIENVQQLTGLPFSWDTASLTAEAISDAMPISERIPNISTRNALYLILSKAGLSYVIEYDTVRITTEKKAKGRMYTKVFSVADLVTPVPNFALPDYANFDKMLNRNALNSGNVVMPGLGNATPFVPAGGLGGGAPAGAQLGKTGTPGMAGNVTFGPRGTLENNPLSASGTLAPDTNTKHEQLIRLITSMVRPYTWEAANGNGKIEFYDLGSALVVNQTADVITEIRDLLEALRRLQDLAVAVEVRIISLSETWFERMGMDFAVNVKTHNTRFEPGLVNNTFRPEPFINDINTKGAVIGLTPAGSGTGPGVSPSFTPDLDVPIRATSFQYAIPGFGGFPNAPGLNGGVSLGLAFLNDIQVYMFMEAAQGDRRVNVMQAPKLTLFNGQTATITIADTQFFVTSVSVISVNGQLVFVPQNNPFPGPGDPFGGGGLSAPGQINVSLQAVVSADRRFVRINLPVTLAAQTGATVPLFPITTFITPVFEGGSQGVPIPFTQFLQQPSFTTMSIQTTVVCPDGGTVLLGGLKALGEGRNEFGPPFLSKIPYLNRLFKNVGIGRETRHIMIMVTPRIIINSEEEINQTEGGGAFGVRPGQ
jgi:type II secretory pathway component GspD/PulD (secretin)